MSLSALNIVKGDTVTLSYQLKEDGVAKDITGMSFAFTVVDKCIDSGVVKIGPITGTIDDASTGKFSFDLTDTETDQDPFFGVYEISMIVIASSDRTTLSQAGGVEFRLTEDAQL